VTVAFIFLSPVLSGFRRAGANQNQIGTRLFLFVHNHSPESVIFAAAQLNFGVPTCV
jgi:hypothetical protein